MPRRARSRSAVAGIAIAPAGRGRRGLAVLGLAALVCALAAGEAGAHGGLRLAEPPAGATLGAAPTAVRLSFSERPELSLSSIEVAGPTGAAFAVGPPQAVPGDPGGLVVRLLPLERGVYTVKWRIASAVDGHGTTGAYAFGVGVSPVGAQLVGTTETPGPVLETIARWLFLVGLVGLLGVAAAGVARFGGARGDAVLGGGAWLLAAAGLVLLAIVQRRNAGVSLGSLLDTSVGRALVWRAVAIGAAGGALLVACLGAPRVRRSALAACAVAALAAMAVHVGAGHAAAGSWPVRASVIAQWAHFAAVGVWLGGLAALLLAVRGAPSAAKAAAVRRFSRIAAVGLAVVAVTGLLRALEELSSWRELGSTGYGRAVVAKTLLLLGIAAFGARNRWRSVPVVARDLGPLRHNARGELALAASALAVAALLGALPPPAAATRGGPTGIEVSGADSGTTTRAQLTTISSEPGANRFVVRATDYDSDDPVTARRVSLRFTPLDDPGVEPTSLALAPGPDDTYAASGDNLAFDGRWRVTVLVEGAGGPVAIPLELETRNPPQFLSIQRAPGRAPKYTAEVGVLGSIRISPDPERAGTNAVAVTVYDKFGEERRIERLVVTAATGDEPSRRQPVRRLGQGRFSADATLAPGRNAVAVVARTSDGDRLRAVFELDVPD